IQFCLEGWNTPHEYEHAEQYPWHPGSTNFRQVMQLPFNPWSYLVVLRGPLSCLRLPEFQKQHQPAHRTEGRNDIHQPGAVIIRDDKLWNGETNSSDESGRPDAQHSTKTRHR